MNVETMTIRAVVSPMIPRLESSIKVGQGVSRYVLAGSIVLLKSEGMLATSVSNTSSPTLKACRNGNNWPTQHLQVPDPNQ